MTQRKPAPSNITSKHVSVAVPMSIGFFHVCPPSNERIMT
jgi:hypothetical protein